MSFIEIPANAPIDPTPLGFDIASPSSSIDGNAGTYAYHNAGTEGTATGTEIDYVFENPIASPASGKAVFISKISFTTQRSTGGRITINGRSFEKNWTVSTPTADFDVEVVVERSFNDISNITLFSKVFIGSQNFQTRLKNIQVFGEYIDIPDYTDYAEFNDSVLETKAWNSSRYDGKQLSAKKLNKSTIDDVGNNNRIPIIRNYTRNIYIGNEIVAMSENGGDDPSLVQFPDFSYVQINSYITVNEDNTITKNRLNPEENNDDQKKAFYRPFTYDFPEGSFCNFILGDPSIKNNLKSKYPIYFNGGQLKKLLTLQPKTGNAEYINSFGQSLRTFDDGFYNGGFISSRRFNSNLASISGAVGIIADSDDPPEYIEGNQQGALYIGGLDNIVSTNTSSPYNYVTATGNKLKLNNEEIYTKFYTGSIAYDVGYLSGNEILDFGSGVDLTELEKFSQNLINYKANSNYKGDKRFFITVTKYHNNTYFVPRPGNPKPLYTFEPGNVHTASLGIRDINLSSLTTLEVDSVGFLSDTHSSNAILEYTFNPNLSTVHIDSSTYHTSEGEDLDDKDHQYALTREKSFVPNAISGSFIFSITEDDIPSLLVPLNSDKDLPKGKGNKPFAVIPENLHPYVKDNIIFYLSKAGIDIGGSATSKVEENNSKRIGKKRILTEAQLRELARRRREARLNKTRRGRRQLRQEERQNRREERREERRENRNERLKERNNRRENRRINKDNRKEKRQDKRENRRQNRRNRRRNR